MPDRGDVRTVALHGRFPGDLLPPRYPLLFVFYFNDGPFSDERDKAGYAEFRGLLRDPVHLVGLGQALAQEDRRVSGFPFRLTCDLRCDLGFIDLRDPGKILGPLPVAEQKFVSGLHAKDRCDMAHILAGERDMLTGSLFWGYEKSRGSGHRVSSEFKTQYNYSGLTRSVDAKTRAHV
jgi:hypothetical protein